MKPTKKPAKPSKQQALAAMHKRNERIFSKRAAKYRPMGY